MRALLALFTTLAMTATGTLAMTFWLLGPLGDGPHPDDEQLISQLRHNRDAFEALRVSAAAATPPGGATYVYGGTARSELAAQELTLLDQMRELEVAVNLVFTDRDPHADGDPAKLQLAVHSRGLLTSGSIKGLLWSPVQPEGPLLTSLDGDLDGLKARGCPEHETCMRHIEGGWYVFYSYDL